MTTGRIFETINVASVPADHSPSTCGQITISSQYDQKTETQSYARKWGIGAYNHIQPKYLVFGCPGQILDSEYDSIQLYENANPFFSAMKECFKACCFHSWATPLCGLAYAIPTTLCTPMRMVEESCGRKTQCKSICDDVIEKNVMTWSLVCCRPLCKTTAKSILGFFACTAGAIKDGCTDSQNSQTARKPTVAPAPVQPTMTR